MGSIARTVVPVLALLGLIAAMLISIEVGYRTARRRRARAPESTRGLASPVRASVFGLMGLLIAFTFAGAGSRFDNRRMLIAQEDNSIEKAYLRLDLLPPESQPQLRQDFRALIFAIVVSSAIYVILDYEYPRGGLIRVDPVDQLLVDTLERMD